ncbi:MAG TPA: 23S rRNA (cytosine(1962)-C(5))-methyltransferase RlmI [Bacteroidetes bacterium]|nr:23S rRNA (cytosine(1962)-C(5))-methyltransferase RlmI [Bacteroidota bacterium]HRR08940.1 class I SAM-dependent methyltransferase [Rhodothermales bacterium]
MNKVIYLKPEKEKSLLRKHPWVFAGAIARVRETPLPGETVEVLSHKGNWLGRGAWSPISQIRVRMWTFSPEEVVDTRFFLNRLKQALSLRQNADGSFPDAFRWVAAESDGLPGLIADRYGDWVVLQFLATGSEFWRSEIVQGIGTLFPVRGIYERSDVDVRKKEGLAPQSGLLYGEAPPMNLWIREGGFRAGIDIYQGHKTGYYLDQSENRARLGHMATGKNWLNTFSYTGGFSLAALAGGAKHVLNVDSSAHALARSEENHRQNGFDTSRYDHLEADVFKCLRGFHTEERLFDGIVLDPPKFVESKFHLEKAARAYKDINRLAFHLLRPGGVLFTFSCSGLMDAGLFQKIVADSALDAQRDVQFIHRMGQAADHPVRSTFPEGFYLKGLICRTCNEN